MSVSVFFYPSGFFSASFFFSILLSVCPFSTRLSQSFSTQLSLLGGTDGFCSSVCVSFSTLQSGLTAGSTVSVYMSVSGFFYPSVSLFIFFFLPVCHCGEGGGLFVCLCVLPFCLRRRWALQYLSTCLSLSFCTRLSLCLFSTRLSLLGGGGGRAVCSSVCVFCHSV